MKKIKKMNINAFCLPLCAWLIGVLAPEAEPQSSYQTNFNFFSDNRQVDVLEAMLSYYRELTAQTGIALSYKVDSISSASISCSTCHKSAQSIQRNQVSLGTKYHMGRTELEAGFYTSREKDYASDAITLSATRPFNQDHTTLKAGYSHSWDRSQPHGWKSLLYGISSPRIA